MLSNTSLNVLRKPLYAAFLTLLQMFGLYIPLAWLGASWLGLTGIFVAALAANASTGVLAWAVLRRELRLT